MKNERKHDIAKIKAHIKHTAADTREKRNEARKLSGMNRWYKQREADENALAFRSMLLAYGYLRGLTIDRMESDRTRPENLPDAGWVLPLAHAVFNKGPDGEALVDRVDDENKWAKIRAAAHQWFWPNERLPKPDHNKEIPGWEEFEAHVRADIAAWNAKLTAEYALREAEKRVA
jgi:hypothetical protein